MAWIVLLLSALFETVWATSLKYYGFTRLWPSVFTIVMMIISVAGLAYAMRTIPLGTAYVIWTGIGAVGAFLLGIILFKDPVTAQRILFASLIVVGLIGLKISTPL